MSRRQAGGMTALSASKASHLATTTLSKILELTRLHQSGQTAPASLKSTIAKNLAALRSSIYTLKVEQDSVQSSRRRLLSEDELRTRNEVLEGLSKQYVRLVGLVEGMGVEVEALPETKASPAEGELVDVGRKSQDLNDEDSMLVDSRNSTDDVPLARLEHHNSPASNSARDQLLSRQDNSARYTRYRDDVDEEANVGLGQEEQARMDEEEMRRANQDVAMLQQEMIDQQDDTLEALSKAIQRQRDLSLTISSELELHEGLLEETDAALDRTGARLSKANKSLKHVAKKTRENTSLCMIATIIIFLCILILLIKL